MAISWSKLYPARRSTKQACVSHAENSSASHDQMVNQPKFHWCRESLKRTGGMNVTRTGGRRSGWVIVSENEAPCMMIERVLKKDTVAHRKGR